MTKTKDVSCEGFFFISERRFSPSEVLDCQLAIPGEDTQWLAEPGMVLHCRAEVVRVAPQADQSHGIACRLTDYTVGYSAAEEDWEISLPVLAAQSA